MNKPLTKLIPIAFALLAINTGAASQTLPGLRNLAQNADVSALVVRLSDMQTLAALNPRERLTPASTSKLFTAAKALRTFGPNHKFITRLTTQGRVTDTTVRGNLNLIGSGDPTLNTRDLQHLAQRLRARGIQRVTGDLVINAGHFGQIPCLTPDRCEAADKSAHSYDAPLSAAGINFGTLHATVYPGPQRGDRTRVVLHPIGLAGYAIDNHSTTQKAGSHPHLRVWRTTDKDQTVLHLRGRLPTDGQPIEIHRSVANAERETALALNRIMADAGVRIDGVARVTQQQSRADDAVTLARVRSRTLQTQLNRMLAYSNNYLADTLTLDIAAAQGQTPPLTLEQAAQSLERLGRNARQRVYGPEAGKSAPRLASGSGLSVRNNMSARDLVALLTAMYRDSALFPAFYGSMPVPKFSPHDMLKQSNLDFLTRITAKTGTLTEPVSARALAGYFRTKNNGFVAYAVLINGTAQNPHPGFNNTVAVYESDLERLLANH
ncbi:D-alanyl-D-alanine carboxypeptidase/D-alanyl-D-alanine-endopeptidase [Salinisphaera sp. USBA-960]|uniref:D-alanyl-D-alanine carboxypeptidase/D-alanyl-D-alanine endopeptidase n=1 Tax=Salinisphaera orenii TaxID=856731 RepID=UPI000DBE3CFD|nr:D-alanyl-D-alanine carboxypeptidase/D-alanyl-D-alanine-endopeptidase [Salifodinibacter halophilus]NNC25760.1 D-alanyl-D-alanine carboxypeptidase/D-alanyl-D-alanine-endopeptidase [Salifodinibacter halophilus]